ncbi:MAG: hypothetical protein Kow0080_05200 [Candidatus Promineifilaceae bacterium]
MSNEILEEIACPNCQNPIDIRAGSKYIICDACNSQFLLKGHICPTCSTYHAEEELFCGECGTALTRVCQKCHTSNWSGNEFCIQCGESLDILELIHVKTKVETAERLNQQMAIARELKKKEAEAAEKRMAELMAIEEERQKKLRELKAQRQKDDRTLLIFGAIGLLVLFLFMALYLAFQYLS